MKPRPLRPSKDQSGRGFLRRAETPARISHRSGVARVETRAEVSASMVVGADRLGNGARPCPGPSRRAVRSQTITTRGEGQGPTSPPGYRSSSTRRRSGAWWWAAVVGSTRPSPLQREHTWTIVPRWVEHSRRPSPPHFGHGSGGSGCGVRFVRWMPLLFMGREGSDGRDARVLRAKGGRASPVTAPASSAARSRP